MLAPKRLLPHLGVLAAVALCLAAVDLALLGTLGEDPITQDHPAVVDWNYYAWFGDQVAGAELQRDRDPASFPPRFGVLLGASTIQRGPLPVYLQKHTHMPWLLLGIGGGTGAMSKMLRSLPTFQRSGLQPKVFVLGVHPFLFWSPPTRERPRTQRAYTTPWFAHNRRMVADVVRAGVQSTRERTLHAFGVPTYVLFEPTERPWDPFVDAPEYEQVSAQEMLEHRQINAQTGRLSAECFRAGNPPYEELRRILATLRGYDAEVVVFLMPEHSELRALVPPVAEKLLRDDLASLGDHAPQIVDLRARIADEDFYDNYHLLMGGRVRVSKHIADELAKLGYAEADE